MAMPWASRVMKTLMPRGQLGTGLAEAVPGGKGPWKALE